MDPGGGTVRDKAVAILSEQKRPMTPKELHAEIKRKYDAEVPLPSVNSALVKGLRAGFFTRPAVGVYALPEEEDGEPPSE